MLARPLADPCCPKTAPPAPRATARGRVGGWGLTFGLGLHLGGTGLAHVDDLLALGVVQGFLQDARASFHARLRAAPSPALKLVLAVGCERQEVLRTCSTRRSPQPPPGRPHTSEFLLPVAGDLALELLALVPTGPLAVAQAAVLAVGDAGPPAPVLALGAILLHLVCKTGSGWEWWERAPDPPTSPQAPPHLSWLCQPRW